MVLLLNYYKILSLNIINKYNSLFYDPCFFIVYIFKKATLKMIYQTQFLVTCFKKIWNRRDMQCGSISVYPHSFFFVIALAGETFSARSFLREELLVRASISAGSSARSINFLKLAVFSSKSLSI